MTASSIPKRAALALTATGVCFLTGVIIHPHAPHALDMAQVSYTQTGDAAWWPAHVLLLSSYALFAIAVINVSRLDFLPAKAHRVLDIARPIAVVSVVAMAVHLLLPLGRDSVANSQHGWAFWVKDLVESVDGVWALCVAAVAWSLGRAGIVGRGITGLLGVIGGIGLGLFSFLIPLTGVVVSIGFTHSLVPAVPVSSGLMIVAWATLSGGAALTRTPHVLADRHAT